MDYPPNLDAIVALFAGLSDEEKRENLVDYAGRAAACAPRTGESFAIADVRKDEECTDTVGVFLAVDPERRAHVRISLGPEVQTLTRALAAILCRGLDGATPEEILAVPADFVPRLVGAQLVRLRSQTVYYVLTRIKAACRIWVDRERTAAAG